MESGPAASIFGDCSRVRQAGEQFPDMELASRIAKQDGETAQTARGSKECGVTVIPNDPVIVLA
jgi:hypothetical protein